MQFSSIKEMVQKNCVPETSAVLLGVLFVEAEIFMGILLSFYTLPKVYASKSINYSKLVSKLKQRNKTFSEQQRGSKNGYENSNGEKSWPLRV